MTVANEHLVLRHKVTGKIASRKDQQVKAISLEAVHLTGRNRGGAIVSLLLPKSPKDAETIATIEKVYDPARVKERSGNSTRKKIKLTALDAVQAVLKNENFWCALAIEYEISLGTNLRPHATSAKAIACWLQKELKKKNSPTAQAAKKHGGSMLLEIERSLRWWTDAIAERRKTQS